MNNEKFNAEGKPIYKDLELQLDKSNIAVGATERSNWVTGCEWVRNVRLLIKCDQPYDAYVYTTDSAYSDAPYASGSISGQAATSGSQYRPHLITGAQGYAIRVGIINKGTTPILNAKIRVQLFD